MHGIHHKVYEHLRHRFGRAKCFRSLHWVTITQAHVPSMPLCEGRLGRWRGVIEVERCCTWHARAT